LPQGCTGTWNVANNSFINVSCQDFCSGTDLHEFYCGDKSGFVGQTIILWNLDANSAQCTSHLPVFEPMGMIVGAIGLLAGLFLVKRM